MASTTENINYKITVDAQTGTAVVRDLKGQIIATKVPVKQLRDEFGNFAKTVNATNFNKFNKGLSTATKANKNLGDASGAATSSVMELSRVVSDAPYGIRGMANNITQLVSQMGFASKKAGGLGAALKEMGKQFMGPLGIVFLVTAAVSALDFFYGTATKASETSNQLNDSLKGLEKTLSTLYTTQDGVNLKIEDYISLTESKIKTNKLVKDSAAEIIKINAEIKEAQRLVDVGEITGFKGNAERKEKLAELEAKRREEIKNTVKVIKEFRKEEESFNAAEAGTLKYYEKLKSNQIDIQRTLSTNSKEYRKYGKDIEKTQKLIDAIKAKKPRPIAVGLNLDAKGVEDFVSGLPDIVGDIIIPAKIRPVTPNEDEMAIFIENYKILMSGITDLVDGEFERQLTTEQNKTNALNQELNNRLLNESLSEEKRKSIQNQIAQNDEALRVKQDAIKKKQFKQQKAFNISMAIISTYSAAAKTLDETTGGSFARIAGMVAVIGSGLAQVAAISRQKFQSSSAQSPINTSSQGGAAGGGGRSESSFNVVGKSEGNLLINAIQAQFGKPLKAYVVSREVTNQQQLDGIIVNQAST